MQAATTNIEPAPEVARRQIKSMNRGAIEFFEIDRDGPRIVIEV
jgi:hypothetical protein